MPGVPDPKGLVGSRSQLHANRLGGCVENLEDVHLTEESDVAVADAHIDLQEAQVRDRRRCAAVARVDVRNRHGYQSRQRSAQNAKFLSDTQ
eukprot:scaffold825_cov249-Pinguiococcus_pyrenoidosus.AAC.11